MGHAWVRPGAKCLVKGFILPHKYYAPSFQRRFWKTLANEKCKNLIGLDDPPSEAIAFAYCYRR